MYNEVPARDSTAVRVALWQALHVQVDPPPHVFDDEVGLRLVAPEDGWRHRPDMDPEFTKPLRASIVARARFIEDLILDQVQRGIGQYVILGAGLDTFVQRRAEMGSKLTVFEIDRPGPQAWKRQRLIELGLGVHDWLRLVPVDFEAGDAWWELLTSNGFDARQPAVVACTGVSFVTDQFNCPRAGVGKHCTGERLSSKKCTYRSVATIRLIKQSLCDFELSIYS